MSSSPVKWSPTPNATAFSSKLAARAIGAAFSDLGGAGLGVKLLDFPSHGSLLIKFREIPALQLWSEHYRGDPRARVHLTQKLVAAKYCDDLERLYDEVKDDYVQVLELMRVYHTKLDRMRQLRQSKANSYS